MEDNTTTSDNTVTSIGIDPDAFAEINRIRSDDSLSEQEKLRKIFNIMGVPESQSTENFSLEPRVEPQPSSREEYTFSTESSIFSDVELTQLYTKWTAPLSKQNFINLSHYIYTTYDSIRSFKQNERELFRQCSKMYIEKLFEIQRAHVITTGKHTFS